MGNRAGARIGGLASTWQKKDEVPCQWMHAIEVCDSEMSASVEVGLGRQGLLVITAPLRRALELVEGLSAHHPQGKGCGIDLLSAWLRSTLRVIRKLC